MSTTGRGARPHVLFVNGGILGLAELDHFLAAWLPREPRLSGDRLLLTERLTVPERLVRRVLCQRLWRDGTLGLRNLDLARLRHELHAGLLARRRMRGRHYDVVHFHRQATAYGSLDLMRRVPAIVSMDCTQDCILETARRRVERWTYMPNVVMDGLVFDRAHCIIATSRWAAQALARRYPDCRTPVHVMPNPVLLEQFDPGWIERRRERSRQGHPVHVLFMGGDFPRKGGYTLLEAWEAGGFAGRARLTIATGTTIDRALPPGVTVVRGIASHSPEWRSLWEHADVFVLPTRNEAFGLVFQEAAAAGLPAIGTRHNAVPEIVRDEETGLLIPVDDPGMLVAALTRLIDDPELRERFGRSGRQHVEQTACPERYMAGLTALVLDAWRSRR